MSDTVQQIKDRLTITDIVSGYVKLDRAGINWKARCPFHAERSPSFIVSPDRGTFHCFGCSVGGDMFTFVEMIEGVDFKGALKMLADRAGVQVVFSKGEKKDEKDRLFEVMEAATLFYVTRLSDEAKAYLLKRGLTEQTIAAFRLGYASDGWDDVSTHLLQKKFTEKEILDAGLAKKGDRGLLDKFRNRIIFPIADTAGRIVAFSGRTFGEHAHPDAPKYLNSPETPLFIKSRILYGYDRAKQLIRKYNAAILVEGQMDLLMSHQAGWANTVAVSGTAFTHEHAQLLKRMSENLVIALDADEAGFKAAARSARAALKEGMQVKIARIPEGLDPADLILQQGSDAWKAIIRDARDVITFLLDALEERAKDADRFRRTVELSVLPFLSDIPSPIAREQYQKEIARRLGVSESAVVQATAQVPVPPVQPKVPPPAQARPADAPNRIKQAYGILLWQESMKVPVIDTDAYSAALSEAIGAEVYKALTVLPLNEKETLRFFAEQLHGVNGSLKRDADALVTILKVDRLREELRQASDALKDAERRGDEAEVDKLAGHSRSLMGEIAKLSKTG